MIEDKKTTIRKSLFKLSSVFPDRKLLPEGIDTYCEMLDDFETSVIIPAIVVCIKECRFFPTIAEIRKQADLIQCLEGDKKFLDSFNERKKLLNADLEKSGN